MGDDAMLLDQKREYTKHLCKVITNSMIQGFLMVYREAKDSRDAKANGILKTFQSRLENVPNWNNALIEKEYRRLNCSFFGDLLKATFITNAKLAMKGVGVPMVKGTKLNVPNPMNFLHKCYIGFARVLWQWPYLMSDTLKPVEQQQNLRQCHLSIKEVVKEVLHESLPLDELYRQASYQVPQAEEEEDDDEEVEEEEDDDEDEEEEEDEEEDDEDDEDEEELSQTYGNNGLSQTYGKDDDDDDDEEEEEEEEEELSQTYGKDDDEELSQTDGKDELSQTYGKDELSQIENVIIEKGHGDNDSEEGEEKVFAEPLALVVAEAVPVAETVASVVPVVEATASAVVEAKAVAAIIPPAVEIDKPEILAVNIIEKRHSHHRSSKERREKPRAFF